MAEQNFSNHGMFLPAFDFCVVPVMTINFFWSIYRWKVSGFSLDGFESVVVAAALVLGFLSARIMALTVQDRLIRLEEQLRYERVLPEELRWRSDELSVNQFVSLRFARHAELPALMRKELDEQLTERKAIMQLIKNWIPDYLRAYLRGTIDRR